MNSMAQWNNLPDPWGWGDAGPPSTCVVHLHLDNIKHIVQRHVRNKAEPWSEWAGREMVSMLVQADRDSVGPGVWRRPAIQLAESMHPAVKEAYHRPLAITFGERRAHSTATGWVPTSSKRILKCILALPNGAMLVVKATSSTTEQILCTCYFPDYVCWGDAATRGKRLARALILEFCTQLPGRVYMHPEPSDTLLKKQSRCLQDQIEFVTGRSWGFECEGQPTGKEVDWMSDGHRLAVRPRLVSRTHTLNSEQPHVCQ